MAESCKCGNVDLLIEYCFLALGNAFSSNRSEETSFFFCLNVCGACRRRLFIKFRFFKYVSVTCLKKVMFSTHWQFCQCFLVWFGFWPHTVSAVKLIQSYAREISSGLLPVICEVTQVKRFWFLSKEREPNVFLIIFYITLGQGLVRRIDQEALKIFNSHWEQGSRKNVC